MTKTKKCRKCGGTGQYAPGSVKYDPTCWRCGGTGVVKDETLVEKYAGWIAQADTQDRLNILLSDHLPHIKNAEIRSEITTMIEKVRPTLPTQAWLDAEDVEGFRERREARRARTTEWEAIRKAGAR